MKALKRNKQRFYYCLFQGEVEKRNEQGRKTGERILQYAEATEMLANISTATGQSSTEQFGNLENYDKVIVFDDLNCPIDESTVLFIDKEPEYSQAVTYNITESNTLLGEDEATRIVIEVPKYDYRVLRIAKSLNSVSVAVSKVNVS